MAKELIVSDDFLTGLDELTPDLKERALGKIQLLAENPAHPSLNAHKIKKVEGKWECYINMVQGYSDCFRGTFTYWSEKNSNHYKGKEQLCVPSIFC